MANVINPTITFLQTCYTTALNSFMRPRGTTQQLAAWDTISFISIGYFFTSIFVVIVELGLGIQAHYGRFSSTSCIPKIPAKIAWFLQEIPAFIIASFFLIKSLNETYDRIPMANRLLLLLFIIHYFNRTFIFPFQIRGGKPTELLEFILAALFTTINGFLQGLCLIQFDEYKILNMKSINFILGVIIFVIGMLINLQSDSILRNLRKPGETGYKIPYGGMFNYVTAANYFGEFLEWTGFAIAGNNSGGIVFAVFTFANLFPRAVATHEWYQKKFDNYPKNRNIFIPFLL